VRTPRLLLRPWTEADLDLFHGIWGDPAVIFWASRWNREESGAMLAKVLARCRGKPLPVAWHAAMLCATGEVVGSVCLQPAPWDSSELEVGWHLRRDAWEHGYATEAAGALIAEAFRCLSPARLVCAILPSNLRSQRAAARLGFTRYAENFLRGDLPHDLLEVRDIPALAQPR